MWVTNNDNNYGFWSNAEYDQLIKDCTTGQYISDYAARWEAMRSPARSPALSSTPSPSTAFTRTS